MNLEETKKIIQNEIEAEALTKNVRSQIKTYIHQKQNLREGFKETFQPLIESQDAVKASIDKEQNELIKQLQENQLALTEGLDKNRLAITQGFDKMEEVKRWDLDQLPSYEAIEEPEEKETEEPKKYPFPPDESVIYEITHRVLNKLHGKEVYPDDDETEYMSMKDILKIHRNSPMDKFRYRLRFTRNTKEALIDDMKPTTTFSYGESNMDKYLKNKESADLLYFYSLKLPSYYRDKSLRELQEAFEKSTKILAEYKDAKKMLQNIIIKLCQEEPLHTPKKVKKQKKSQNKKLKIIISWKFTITI